ncbi:MAG TPA: DEAD/DEAH box helicase family protein [Saprospiraceae bacterium]|nr:DEAD/DEAH box helicase family protein [Saprospiraceae bacterium]
MDKPAVDSFLSTSSRHFKDEQLRSTGFAHRLWISTTNKWGPNAEEAIRNQSPPVNRIGLHDLENANVDWEKLAAGELARSDKKTPRPHQIKAIAAAHAHFQTADRGKLIMDCGTGKTFTSLKIAEQETGGAGAVLFLVPSIALLGQTLNEWTGDAEKPFNAICICSDAGASKKRIKNDDSDGYSVVDLALPASTDIRAIIQQFEALKVTPSHPLTVVFSTYQSIEVIAEAQKALRGIHPVGEGFDLIICDEAHRTTGVTLADDDESAFVKVHNNDFLRAKKRLYMTATPRLFNDDAKNRAAQAEAVLCSMDEPDIYGEEIYRIGFGEAVNQGLLSDYKVLILTVSENDMTPAVQKMVKNEQNEINADDTSKLIGCINALSKKILGDQGILKDSDPEPMRRAVAFCQNIKVSDKTAHTFNLTKEVYFGSLEPEAREELVHVKAQHVDGGMNTPTRDEKLSWLKAAPEDSRECRILTNVRCLSEGVDVPSLDAVLFLSARNSQVDVVQSVGRVMRLAPGKKYGYIIIPVVVPADIEPEKALNDNERFRVVWTVLNALRAHDDRFNATVNKIELNKRRPDHILVGAPDNRPADAIEYAKKGDRVADPGSAAYQTAAVNISRQLAVQFEQLQSVVFARMVEKVGDRRYWERWAKDVAVIAERHIERIRRLIRDEGAHQRAFAEFLAGLQKNINPAISENEAVEMLAQHIITKPVFEALFEGYSFVKNNPISVAMQAMLDLLEDQQLDKDTETLQKFYESVRARAAGIDNAEGKQRIIVELYDKFFKTAFPKMVEQLGIVYTPVEVVDFIVRSADALLRQEFGRSLSDENIHILDPFTGTGTFMTRLLQSGLIRPEDLERKYARELHANEIVLLAYYIAAINIENAYHDATPDPHDGIGKASYTPFDGIVLTDTFQLGETDDADKLFSAMFPQNSARVQAQQKAPLRVIIGNPPYSVGQKSANDNAQNQDYPKLDARIAKTYAAGSKATSVKALYDAYIKAFRWSTDRLDPKHGGIIAFVSNGAWLDSNGMDSFRKCLEKEFSSIYVFNLRGNQRTSGELSRKEGGKIFGSGSRTPIAVTFLVKNPTATAGPATIYYHDIGDYLSREEKLGLVKKFGSIESMEDQWQVLQPNEHGDWLNLRDDVFGEFIPLAAEDKFDAKSQSFFLVNSLGLASGRDSWVYNFSKLNLEHHVNRALAFFNEQSIAFRKAKESQPILDADDFIDSDPQKLSWNRNLKQDLEKFKIHSFRNEGVVVAHYRPFCKNHLYFDKDFNAMLYQNKKLFPTPSTENRVICVSGVGASKDFSALITDCIPDLQLQFNGQCFPLYYYEDRAKAAPSLFDVAGEPERVRRDGVSDFILGEARARYGDRVSKEDVFYYVYGFLHSPEYRERFSSDLKKMLPRLPLVESPKDFWAFSKAGRLLADLHLHYDDFSKSLPAEGGGVRVLGAESGQFRVEKMRFPSKTDKSRILYNSHISIENIPAQAYEYVVNGKSAIEWVMERYAITTHKDSGIRNDPNDWAAECGNPRYILDVLLSVIRLSVETVEVVRGLPGLNL